MTRPQQPAIRTTVTTTPRPTGNRDLDELTARRFPLVPRRKPACAPLTDRIRRVHQQAERASRHTDTSLLHAAEAHNLAALILSDCAMPTHARALCWRQFNVFASHGPYDQTTAKLALQPLINIGRLDTRAGDSTAAYQLHQAMLQAAKTRTTTTIDGRHLDLAHIVRPGDDHTEIVQWLWTVLLADGLRALCRAGRWSEAHTQAERHHGIGERLLDGRQIAILSHSAAGDHTTALHLLHTTTTETAWERAVAACLTVLCLRRAGQQTSATAETMSEAYLQLQPDPQHTAFNIRLGLTAASLATDTDTARLIIRKAAQLAADSADAYAAQEILSLTDQSPVAEPTIGVLRDAVRHASLGTAVPAPLLDDLLNAVKASEQQLLRALGTGSG